MENSINKVYCILGATSDIGMKYMQELNCLNEKITIIAVYFGNKEKLENLSKELKNLTFDFVECDLSNNEDVNRAIEYIKEKYQSPTHFLHLAARKFEYVKFSKIDWKNIELDLNIQVHSFFEFMQAFLPVMSKNKYGKVVVMLSSVTQGLPPKYLAAYTLTKYALMGLMKSLVSEYREKGININAVSPTMVETSFLENIDERIIELTATNSGMKRNVKIEEVTSAIRYLMSEEAEYINGQNILLSGGDIL